MPDSKPGLLSEEERLAVLRDLRILDTAPDQRLDKLTALAANVFQCPIALVTLIDEHRQWFKSRQGIEGSETPREYAFCATTIQRPVPLIVLDATQDERFQANPYVTGEPGVRFYAGAPVIVDNAALGAVCVVDRQPHERVTDGEMDILRQLAALVAERIVAMKPQGNNNEGGPAGA
ncbi:MAG TPA: GAF domain-containing protein [Burkholderiales bacterium]